MPQLANFQCSFPTTPAPSNSITKSMSSVSLSFCCLGDFRGFQCHASGSYRFIVVKCSHYGLKSRLLCHRPKSTCSLGTKFLNNERRGWHGRIHLEYYICDYDYAVVLSLTYSVNCTSQILEYYLLDSSAQLLECRLRNLKRLIDLSRIQSDKPICLPPVPVVFSTIMTFECLTGPGGCSDIETLSLRRAESLANRRPNCPRTRLPLFVVVTSRYSSAWRDFISFVLYLCGRSRVRVVRQEFHDYTTGMRYKTQRRAFLHFFLSLPLS
ncbi:hypothetical protein BDV93DRAFT_290312 [Ceratobasidium sp. AG-I]|nr:hypothetical protein BDV93DRAFT_290312 [Ceratobasidium sp. AG-I]